jgi:hypothetical protein
MTITSADFELLHADRQMDEQADKVMSRVSFNFYNISLQHRVALLLIFNG